MRVAHNLPYSQVRIVAYGFPWINGLRWFRIALAKTSMKSMQKLDTQERTVASGQLHKQLKWLNIVLNKYTIMPFSWFSRLFSDSDYSDGYLLFVRKNEPDS